MYGILWRLGVIVLAAGVLSGCKSNNVGPNKQHPDPLVRCHKPVDGKPRTDDGDRTVRLDPPPPPVPRQDGIIVRQRAPLGPPRPLQVGLDYPE